MIKLTDKNELRDLILKGISSEELNSKYDYSGITSMHQMFEKCSNLRTIPDLDTSNVTNVFGMFEKCSNLRTIPDLDTSNVTSMSFMFDGCANLESIPNLDTSKVTGMIHMFDDCYKLKNVNPYNYHRYDFSKLDNKFLKEEYPELYI